MPHLPQDANCCGCTACYAVCPKDAITMKADSLGFKYPTVDYDKCIECKACERVCAFRPDYKTPLNFNNPKPYGLRLKDSERLMKSRSGGAFQAFSDWVLSQDGAVYGAAYDESFRIVHCRAENESERDAMLGSKYVQSHMGNTFRRVRDDLKAGKWVLFSGTGCQVSGLQSFIPESLKARLVTVDIVCHGVPSPEVWQSFLEWIETKSGKKVVGVNFRDKKKFGWEAHHETLSLQDAKGCTEEISSRIFTYLFYRHIMFRPSCGKCWFTNLRRPADITLADFWGWQKTDTSINADDKGISLVLVNTAKGRNIFNDCKDLFNIVEPELKNIFQPQLEYPSELNPLSKKFARDFEKKGFSYVLTHYGNQGWRYELRRFRNRVMRKFKQFSKSHPSVKKH